MRFRKLRIAWSVVCAMLCLLMIAYWIRSYSMCDRLHVPIFGSHTAISVVGTFSITSGRKAAPGRGWELSSTPVSELMQVVGPGRSWSFRSDQSYIFLVFPHRIFVLIFAILAAAPWVRWQFGLRSLLVFTTLIALMLGALVYVAKR